MGNESRGIGREKSKATPEPRRKKPYLQPSLVEYGDVAKLTQSGFGSGDDGGAVADMMMKCL